ncbi:hypothetical protein N7481_008710 [Penicillium waksmanii]|uniref:uncharacterized protein n=1 Tax=Penicillium waksmanii TaxID=69791 RepID=UPI002546B946|nr:uncharacterized protein N7481_008710 [Penicillium waksmanii]KAJ5975003.1 hypothetical protein N7481_008710 [Penicillium waksmanii]
MANAGIERRVDIQIPSSSDDMMCGWLYSSDHFTSSCPGSAIVLAHGLGGTKELKSMSMPIDSTNWGRRVLYSITAATGDLKVYQER